MLMTPSRSIEYVALLFLFSGILFLSFPVAVIDVGFPLKLYEVFFLLSIVVVAFKAFLFGMKVSRDEIKVLAVFLVFILYAGVFGVFGTMSVMGRVEGGWALKESPGFSFIFEVTYLFFAFLVVLLVFVLVNKKGVYVCVDFIKRGVFLISSISLMAYIVFLFRGDVVTLFEQAIVLPAIPPRIQGFFVEPSHFAYLLASASFFFLRDGRWGKIRFMVVLSTLLFTFSTSGWLAFIFIFCVYMYISKAKLTFFFYMMLFLVLFVFSYISVEPVRDVVDVSIVQKLVGDEGVYSASRIHRLKKWEEAIEVYQSAPFFGIGVSNFGLVLSQSGLRHSDFIDNVGNVFIEILIETGPVGLLLILILHFLSIRMFFIALRCCSNEKDRGMLLAIGMAYLALLVGWFHFPSMLLMYYWVVLALLVRFSSLMVAENSGGRVHSDSNA